MGLELMLRAWLERKVCGAFLLAGYPSGVSLSSDADVCPLLIQITKGNTGSQAWYTHTGSQAWSWTACIHTHAHTRVAEEES